MLANAVSARIPAIWELRCHMTDAHVTEQRTSQKLRGRDRRSLNLSTKLTVAESKSIEVAASRVSKTPSEWARDVLLRAAAFASHSEMELHIFTELVGIQMLLMNTLEPLLRGEKLAQEQLAILFRQVQTTKATQALELLAKRSRNREK
jgi:hypothetical protein